MVAVERSQSTSPLRQLILDLLGDREEVLGVPAPDSSASPLDLQALERVRADRLQHREARLAVGLFLLAEQAVVDQRREPGEDVLAAADGLGGVERAAAGEDGEAREERLLVRAEQVVAPVDRRAERLLAGGQVARAAGEEVEALLEPREQRLRREQLRARGRELDRERQPVEADADLGDRGRVRVREGEVGSRPGPVRRRARPRRTARATRSSGRCAGSGRPSGGTGNSCSPDR